MDEGRLAAVNRRRDCTRKSLHIMNDIIRNKQDIYTNYLVRDEASVKSRLGSEVQQVRKTVVRNKVLLQCMEALRQKETTKPQFGVYQGRALESFSRDIDGVLAWNHPKLRRQRKVEKARENLYKHGAILDSHAMKTRVDDFIARTKQREPSFSLLRKSKNYSSENATLNPLFDKSRFKLRNLLSPPVDAANVRLSFDAKGHLAGVEKNPESNMNNAESSSEDSARVFQRTNLNAKPLPGIASSKTDADKSFEACESAFSKSKSLTQKGRKLEENTKENTSDKGEQPSSKLSSLIVEDKDEDHQLPVPKDEPLTISRAPTLVLPPIRTTKSFAQDAHANDV